MNTFSEIIQSNTLPTLEDFKSNQEKFFGFSVPFIAGFIEKPDVRVSMDINEFMTFVKDNSLDSIMTCDFSGFYRKYKDRLNEWAEKYRSIREFDKDEVEYDMVLMTEGLVAGYASESTYRSLLKVFA